MPEVPALTLISSRRWEKNALLNAVSHSGKAEVGAAVSKTLGESPALRAMAKEVAKAAADVVRRVNSLSPAQQQQLLEERYPEALIASEQRKTERKKEEATREEQLPSGWHPARSRGRSSSGSPPSPRATCTSGTRWRA